MILRLCFQPGHQVHEWLQEHTLWHYFCSMDSTVGVGWGASVEKVGKEGDRAFPAVRGTVPTAHPVSGCCEGG